MLQLACVWNLAHPGVECVVPTLIQEPGPDAKPIERKREELAGVPDERILSDAEVDEIRTIGDNRGSMLLKGGTPDHEGDELPDRWEIDEELAAVAERWAIDPQRDLRKIAAPV
jgi:hypothetical protein